MLRKLFAIAVWVLGGSTQAFAAVSFQGMNWRADSRLELNLSVDGSPMNFKANMRDGDTTSVKSGPVTVELKSYLDYSNKGALPFVTVIVFVDGQDTATVLLLEKEGAGFRALTRPVLERRASAHGNLEGIFKRLKDPSIKNWGAEQSIKAMAAYFTQNPRKQLFDFYDKVELGTLELPRPSPPATASVRTPQIPAGQRSVNPQALEPRAQPPAGGELPEEEELLPPPRPRATQQRPPPQYDPYEQERRRQWEWQQQQQQRQMQQGYGYGYGYGNGYDPRYQRPPPQQRGFFDQLFGR